MIITERLKERFCKDCNIPIKIFKEPYFEDRIKLYDKFYDTIDKFNLFISELELYQNEQEYFEEYNKVKDVAIEYIKSTSGYKRFNDEDMNRYKVSNTNLPNTDIFKPSNDNKWFLSIDMRKANFSSLKYYSYDIFDSQTWEGFISKFTKNKHIINSKYIRQVILGNCNPKRQVTFEKYIMDDVLNFSKTYLNIDNVVFFSNDEIVFDVTNINHRRRLLDITSVLENNSKIPFRVELFSLNKIVGIDGYYKNILKLDDNGSELEFKCLNSYMIPFVIRKILNEDVQESDMVFYHEGLLSKFMEIPKIEI